MSENLKSSELDVKSDTKFDANDYSRFDGMSDDDDDDSTLNQSPKSTLTLQEALSKSSILKDSGNAFFKSNNFSSAKESYNEAIKLLDDHKGKSISELGDHYEGMKNVLVSLYGNMGMVMFKEENWVEVVKNSNDVLRYDSSNVKALYRRSVSYHRTGRYEESKLDLQRVLELDPTNSAAKKELVDVHKSIKDHQRKEKQSFTGMFSKGSMYEDKEKERLAKQKADEIARQQEQDDYVKSRMDRRERGLSEQTFDEWKKERDDEAKEAKKRREQEEKKSTSSSKEKKPTHSSKPKKSSESGSAEYDEEDEKVMREVRSKGYCHFRRDLPTEESELIGDIRPKALHATEDSASSSKPTSLPPDGINPSSVPLRVDDSAAAPPPSNGSKGTVTASSWNHAGTWEERDTTEYCKGRIKELLGGVSARMEGLEDGGMAAMNDALKALSSNTGDMSRLENLSDSLSIVSARVSEVQEVKGEAQIVIARGKKRHVYDFTAVLKFEATVEPLEGSDSKKAKTYKGTVHINDISPQDSDNTPDSMFDISVSYKKSPPPARVEEAGNRLKRSIVNVIQQFAAEYTQM